MTTESAFAAGGRQKPQKCDQWGEKTSSKDQAGVIHYALGSNGSSEWCVILATSSLPDTSDTATSITEDSFDIVSVEISQREASDIKLASSVCKDDTVPSVVHCNHSNYLPDVTSWLLTEKTAQSSRKSVKPRKTRSSSRNRRVGETSRRTDEAYSAALAQKLPLHHFFEKEEIPLSLQRYGSPVEALKQVSLNTSYEFLHVSNGSFSCIPCGNTVATDALVQGCCVQSYQDSQKRSVAASGELRVFANGLTLLCRLGLLSLPLSYIKQQITTAFPCEVGFVDSVGVFTGLFRRKKSLTVRRKDGTLGVGPQCRDWVVVFSPNVILSCQPQALQDMMVNWDENNSCVDISGCYILPEALRNIAHTLKPAVFYLLHPVSGGVLHVDEEDVDNDVKVQLRPRNGSTSQKWTYCNGSLINAHSGKALEVSHASGEGVGWTLHLSKVHCTECQTWMFAKGGRLFNPYSNRALCHDGSNTGKIFLSDRCLGLTWNLVPWKLTPM